MSVCRKCDFHSDNSLLACRHLIGSLSAVAQDGCSVSSPQSEKFQMVELAANQKEELAVI